MGARFATGKVEAVAGLQFTLTLRCAKSRVTRYNDEQFVVAQFVVIRERRLTWWKRIQARAEVVAREPLALPLEPRTLRRPGARHPAFVIQQVHFHGGNLKRA